MFNKFVICLISILSFVSVLTEASGNQCVDLFKQHRDAGTRIVSQKIDGSPLTAKEVEDKLKKLVKKYFINFQKIAKARSENKEIKELNTYQEELSRQIDEIMRADYRIPDFNTHLNKLRIEELERIRKEYDAQSNKRAIADQREKDRKSREEQERQERERERKEASDPIHKAKVNEIVFHDIEPGSFMMNEIVKQVKVTLTQPYAMMQTLFTQMMYSRLMIAFGETDTELINPSSFKTGSDSVEVTYNGVTYLMKPDHPVEQVSWYDLRGEVASNEPPSPDSFLGKLNILSNSDIPSDQALLKKLIPGHEKGDIYDLPTNAQTEFVMRDRGNTYKTHFNRDDEAEVANYAWHRDNSKTLEYPDGSTHEVATLQPRMIDVKGDGNKQPFYDLEGNVFKWGRDSWDGYGSGSTMGGTDPLGTSGSSRVVRGGSWSYGAHDLHIGARSSHSPDERSTYMGFRLVRTRP